MSPLFFWSCFFVNAASVSYEAIHTPVRLGVVGGFLGAFGLGMQVGGLLLAGDRLFRGRP